MDVAQSSNRLGTPLLDGHKNQLPFRENVEEFLKSDNVPVSSTYNKIIQGEEDRYKQGFDKDGKFEDSLVVEMNYNAEAHPLVGRPMCGVFYCNGARLCLAPCLPSQARIRNKLIKRYKGKDLNLLGAQKDPLDCFHTSAEFSLNQWCRSAFYDRRVRALAATFLFSAICVYYNCCMQVVAQHMADRELAGNITLPYKSREAPYKQLTSVKKLPDLFFTWIPKLSDTIADSWLKIYCGVTAIRFALTPMRLTILRRLVFCVGVIFFFRGSTIVITLLPNPFYECERKGWDEGLLDHPLSGGLYVMLGQASTCADVFFSGHTANTTLLALVWHQYNHVVPLMNGHLFPRWMRTCFRKICCCGMHMKSRRYSKRVRAFQATTRLTPSKLLAWVGACVEYYLIIATHFHYTVDVFVAFILAIMVWKFYHYYISHTHQSSQKVGAERGIMWLEGGAEDIAQLSKDIAAIKEKVTPEADDLSSSEDYRNTSIWAIFSY